MSGACYGDRLLNNSLGRAFLRRDDVGRRWEQSNHDSSAYGHYDVAPRNLPIPTTEGLLRRPEGRRAGVEAVRVAAATAADPPTPVDLEQGAASRR